MSARDRSLRGEAARVRDGRGEPKPLTRAKTLRGASPLQRIEALSVPCPMSGCWLWLGHMTMSGNSNAHPRPVISMPRGRSKWAHRIALEERLGRVLPARTMALHSCDNPYCVNPEHLAPGTHRKNMREMAQRGRASRKPNGGSKLTPFDGNVIRVLHVTFGTRAIAQEIGCTEQHIRKVVAGQRLKPQLAQAAE